MKENVNVIHVRLKSGKSIQPGNLDIDPSHFVVIPLFGDFFAVYSDFHYVGTTDNVLLSIIHKSNFIIIEKEK